MKHLSQTHLLRKASPLVFLPVILNGAHSLWWEVISPPQCLMQLLQRGLRRTLYDDLHTSVAVQEHESNPFNSIR